MFPAEVLLLIEIKSIDMHLFNFCTTVRTLGRMLEILLVPRPIGRPRCKHRRGLHYAVNVHIVLILSWAMAVSSHAAPRGGFREEAVVRRKLSEVPWGTNLVLGSVYLGQAVSVYCLVFRCPTLTTPGVLTWGSTLPCVCHSFHRRQFVVCYGCPPVSRKRRCRQLSPLVKK